MSGGRPARPAVPRARRALVCAVATGALLGLAACSPGGPGASADALPTGASTGTPAPHAPEEGGSEAVGTGTPAAGGTEAEHRSQVGDLVPGFPVDLLPLPPDAVILVTSAAPVGEGADVQEVSLNVRTRLTVDEVVTLYREALVSAGFVEADAADAPTELTAEATFTRSGGDELVSVGVLEIDGGRTVTIGGRVRTGD